MRNLECAHVRENEFRPQDPWCETLSLFGGGGRRLAVLDQLQDLLAEVQDLPDGVLKPNNMSLLEEYLEYAISECVTGRVRS